MTEGTTTTAAASSASTPAPGSQRRKPRRKRNAGKKNEPSSQQKGGKGGSSKYGKKKSGAGGNNNNSPPPPPQIKVTIRNIQNPEKFGSVKSILEGIVSKFVESCVELKANNQYAIELDRTAVRHLITEEEKVEERREKMVQEKAQLEEAKDSNDENGDKMDVDDGKDENEEVKGEETGEDTSTSGRKEAPDNDNKLDVIISPKLESNLPTIVARPLYVVPPRKTKRRGERGGTAYVLLIGPKIEKAKPILPSNATDNADENDKLVHSAANHVEQQDSSESKIVKDEENDNDKTATTDALEQQDSSDSKIVKDEENDNAKTATTAAVDSSNESKPTPGNDAAPEKVINYPQELAKGRLLLSKAIKGLIELATEDTKNREFAFSDCIVEQSMNGKTWKLFQNSNSRPDRREGTIENTAGFKDWLEATAKQKEELKARPKPVPGGGVTSTATTTNGDEMEDDGQPVSSLVQHLRAKRLDAKRKKSQKKKKKEENNKGGKSKGEKGQSENEKRKKRNEKNRKNKAGDGASAAAAAKKAKRKKKERARKKEKAMAAAAATTGSKAPTALLKP